MLGIFGLMAAVLGACAYADPETQYPSDYNRRANPNRDPYSTPGSVFGPGGFDFLGGSSEEANAATGGAVGIGVNSFLWRASLDTLSFMPLASADPFGGVIITDWYAPPETQNERFKVTVYILGRDLRADGIRAAVFRQVRTADGTWVDAKVEPKTATDLEDAILTRARQLRVAGLQ
ncbi:MAG: DUF3576 domain-containing protein [Alphaproteobacteria bacterium]|nr:MAG: DUF3576 domain-containing protein [Alphaproteobacteria bacterium]